MEDHAWIAIVCGAVGTVVGLLATFILDMFKATRSAASAARRDAMDEVYRLYGEVKTDLLKTRDSYTASLVECERRGGVIARLQERLREHGLADGDGGDEPANPAH